MNEKLKLLKQYQAMADKLQQELDKDQAMADTLAVAHQQLLDALRAEGISFNKYVESQYKDIKKATDKYEKTLSPAEAPKKRGRKPKATAKKKRGRKKAPSAPSIKIPAGQYKLPDSDTVYTIQSRGARPKEVKAVALSMGIEAFMEQCRIGD